MRLSVAFSSSMYSRNEFRTRRISATSCRATPSTNGIELVEQVNAPAICDFIEDKPQLSSRFAHVARNERFKTDHEQWQTKLSRECLRCHRLA